MRDLNEVLHDMIALVPIPELTLVRRLHTIRTSLDYVPPEQMSAQWRIVQSVLADQLELQHTPPAELTGWKLAIMKIWTGNPSLGGLSLPTSFKSIATWPEGTQGCNERGSSR